MHQHRLVYNLPPIDELELETEMPPAALGVYQGPPSGDPQGASGKSDSRTRSAQGTMPSAKAQGKMTAKAAKQSSGTSEEEIGIGIAASSAMGGRQSGSKRSGGGVSAGHVRGIRGGGGGRGMAIACDPPEEFSSLMIKLESGTALPYQLSLPLHDQPTLQCFIPSASSAAVTFVPFQVHTLTAPHILCLISWP